MTKFFILAAAMAVSAPALAHDRIDRAVVEDDGNPFWLDYRTDISEARRELASDLRRAKTADDRREAREEYRRELADARRDYNQEMQERGLPTLRRGRVTVEGD